MKVMSPSANAPGSHRWLHINLAVHGDRELTHPGIVKLLAAAWPPRGSDDAGNIHDNAGNRAPARRCDVDLFRMGLPLRVTPGTK